MKIFIRLIIMVLSVGRLSNTEKNNKISSIDNTTITENNFEHKLADFVSKGIYLEQNFTTKDSLFNSTFTISLLNNNLILNDSQHGPVYSFTDKSEKVLHAKQEIYQTNIDTNEKYKASLLKTRQTNSNDLFETVSESSNDDIGNAEYTTEPDNETTTAMSNVTELSDIGFENSTEFMNVSTTMNTSISTSTLPPTTPRPTIWKRSKSRKSKDSVCYCDLTKYSCDVNCCCDLDCSESDKSVFSTCMDHVKDSRHWSYCSAKDLDYKDTSPWLLEKQSSSLFCVYKENLPPKLKKKRNKIITSNEELEKVAKQYFSWPDMQYPQRVSFDNSKPYSHNDNIWILLNSTLTTLDVPTSYLNIMCTARKNLKYLVNYKSQCYSALQNSDTFNIYLMHRSIHLISSPVDVNETWIGNIQDCPKNICIPMIAYVCTLKNCTLLNITEERFVPSCENNFCRNMITSIKYHLYSNGTSGFTNARIFFGLSDIFVTSNLIEQKFEVTHIWISKNSSDSPVSLSGNPGYLEGKPVIISRVVTHSEANSSEIITMFDYFKHNNSFPLRNVLSFPKNINGFCVYSNVTYNEINYGENIEFKCKITLNVSEFILKSNGSDACVSLQNKIMAHNTLMENTSSIYVSSTGNPRNDPKTWIEIIHGTQRKTVEGVFDELNKTLFCKYLIRKLKYEFAYVVNDQSTRVNQMNIVGSRLSYVTDYEMAFDVREREIFTMLSVNSMFYDVTTPEAVEYAKGPSFKINLPSDFFHPFTLSSQSSKTTVRSYFTSIVIICMLICRHT